MECKTIIFSILLAYLKI